METAKLQKVSVTFKCINCRAAVNEKMHPIHAKHISIAGGCCDACCKIAHDYFASEAYHEFESSENA